MAVRKHHPARTIRDGRFRLAFARRPEQIAGREVLGLKARNVIAWAGASPASGGPGSLPPKPRGLKARNFIKLLQTSCAAQYGE
jgi:hypothetical protein